MQSSFVVYDVYTMLEETLRDTLLDVSVVHNVAEVYITELNFFWFL